MKRPFAWSFALLALIAVGCARDDMWHQKRVDTYEESEFFADGVSTRVPVEGTVARGTIKDDDLMYEGTENGQDATRFPFAVDAERLERGRGRYDAFCMPCHGVTGDGYGMIVQRGFKQPEPFTADHLLAAAPGYYFRVLKVGFTEANDGAKLSGLNDSEGTVDYVHPPLYKKLGAEDAWATIAYIRALQVSQNMSAGQLSQEELDRVNNPQPKEEANGGH